MEILDLRGYVSCALVVLILHFLNDRVAKSRQRKERCYPPGPRGLPIVGNFFDTPASFEWLRVAEWGKRYGDLVYTEAFGLKTLYLNSHVAAVDLLENRSANYSSRPPFVLAREIAGLDWLMTISPYDARLRKQRALAIRYLQPSVLHNYHPLQWQLVLQMLMSILESPQSFEKHIRRFPAALVMKITYGHDVTSDDDVFITRVDEGARYGGIALVADYVDVFPFLKYLPSWFPGAKKIQIAREGYQTCQDMCYEAYRITKKAVMDGTATPCMTSFLIEENIDNHGYVHDEDTISSVAAAMYIGSSDTIVTTIMTLVLAMVLYPDVLRKAHEELDRVIGKDTLPAFSDRSRLPYIRAVCQECLRWEVVSPIGPAHIASKDDTYRGFFIPAGTIIRPNQWAMANDPQVYESPDEFLPERWLGVNGSKIPVAANRIAFGFGRRICVGKDFAEATVFIAVANLLAAFDIMKSRDENGVPIMPSREMSYLQNATVRRAMPFPCSIVPRSEKVAQLIRDNATSL